MSEAVNCQYLGRVGARLKRAPLPGPLGERILNEISQEAWQQWLAHQTMLINENRLSPIDPAHRQYLINQAEAFLFGGEVDQAIGYVPPEAP